MTGPVSRSGHQVAYGLHRNIDPASRRSCGLQTTRQPAHSFSVLEVGRARLITHARRPSGRPRWQNASHHRLASSHAIARRPAADTRHRRTGRRHHERQKRPRLRSRLRSRRQRPSHAQGSSRTSARSTSAGGSDSQRSSGHRERLHRWRRADAAYDRTGDFEVEQMYVQYMIPSDRKAKYPLLMWHGGGLTGVCWETKPDGKARLGELLLQAGASDLRVRRGRARPRLLARYPEINSTPPFFRTKKEAWELFPHRAGGPPIRSIPPKRVRQGETGASRSRPSTSSRSSSSRAGPRATAATLTAYHALVAEDRRQRDPGAQPVRQFRLQRGAGRARQGEGRDRDRARGCARHPGRNSTSSRTSRS